LTVRNRRLHRIVGRVAPLLLALSLAACSLYAGSDSLQAQSGADNRLVLTEGQKEIVLNGRRLPLAQPFVLKNGIPYAPLTGIARAYGYKVSYDAAGKQSVAASPTDEFRFRPGSRVVAANGKPFSGKAQAYALKGSLMIPLDTWAELTGSRVVSSGAKTVLEWDSAPETESPDPKPAIPADFRPGKLKVSEDGRFLATADGKPFFWLADTAWEAIQRLKRADVEKYLKNSAEQGFNVVQIVALTHFWNLGVPNAHGDLPLVGADPDKPRTTDGNDPGNAAQYDYWDHADYVVDTAAAHGLYVALLPTWGKYILDNRSTYRQPYEGLFDRDKAYRYGRWIGSRYADRSNVVWVLGGDRAPADESQKELIRQMAKGIRDGGAAQLMTFHPIGTKSSSEWFHRETWLDFNMYQSGHLSRDYPNDAQIAKDYARSPAKPVLDAEPRYEDSAVNFDSANGRFTAYDVRQAAYWAVFAGAFGHSYGHGAIWQMHAPGLKADEKVYWYDALKAEGRTQMKYLRRLVESRPMAERTPDQSLVEDERSGGERLRAVRGTRYAMVYSPRGSDIRLRPGVLSGENFAASWYDPRTGESTPIEDFSGRESRTFRPPTNGDGQDWVLLIDDKDAGFRAP